MAELQTIKDVESALGGVEGLVALTGANRGAVMMWRYNGFPRGFYKLMLSELHAKGLDAPGKLWGQKERHQQS